jgi:predicted esterase
MNDAQSQTDLSLTAEIKLYYDLYVPDKISTPAPLLIAVHGYGAHKRYMMREAKLVAPEGFVIASVQAPYQHFRPIPDGSYKIGFGWLTDFKAEESVALHHKFLNDLISKLAEGNLIDTSNISLYGFSQACALNFRYAFTFPNVLKAIVGVCGGIPGDLDSSQIYKPFDAVTFYLYGDKDEFYNIERFHSFDEKLNETLSNYSSREYDADHSITEDMRVDIRQFLHSL